MRLLPFVLLMACEAGPDTGDTSGGGGGDDTGEPVDVCLPATGAGGDPAAALAATTPLESFTFPAQNTVEIDVNASVGRPALHSTAFGPCGDGGVAWIGRSGPPQLHYTPLGGADEVPAVASANDSPPSLFYDADCEPVVVSVLGNSQAMEASRATGSWTSGSFADATTQGLGSIRPIAADSGLDGNLHYFFGDGAGRVFHAQRPSTPGAGWNTEELPGPLPEFTYDMAVDSQGRVHTVYAPDQSFPCDPCDVSVRHGLLEAGAWTETVLDAGVWGPPRDELVKQASIAIDDDDRPIVAGWFQTRAITGSLQTGTLRIYSPDAGDICVEEPVIASDGYEGSDGPQYTGAHPAIAIDAGGRLHLAFTDLSSWHDGDNLSNTIPGQLRYAVRAGGAWHTSTLVSQSGQTVSAQPLEGLVFESIAVAQGRVAISAQRFSWATDSIYNTGSPDVTMNAELFDVTVAP